MGIRLEDLSPEMQERIKASSGGKKKSKYGAIKTEVDGITFDSRREAHRYKELKLLERAGAINSLELQKEFELQPSFHKNGKTYRAIKYVADFAYYDVETKEYVIEDSKGMRTDVYKLKKKLFEYRYPDFEIREV